MTFRGAAGVAVVRARIDRSVVLASRLRSAKKRVVSSVSQYALTARNWIPTKKISTPMTSHWLRLMSISCLIDRCSGCPAATAQIDRS